MVAKCKSDCGAIRGWWVQAQFDGMLTLGMEAKIPIPGKCYDKGDKYRNNPVNEIDPCPHAPYMPNLCAERDVCIEYDRNVAKNDGASFQSARSSVNNSPSSESQPHGGSRRRTS